MAEDHPGASPAEAPTIAITISKGGKQVDTFRLPEGAILNDLVAACENNLIGEPGKHYDWDKAKFIAKGKMLKASEHGEQPVGHLDGTKVTLQVPTVEAIQSLQDTFEARRAHLARLYARANMYARAPRVAAPTRRRANQGDGEYTFLRVEPLPGFSNAAQSREFLQRLTEDPGIRAAMRKHRFTVGLLTEMDPASNTQASHEGTTRLLGLNRNRGEVIELRLRTDDYSGYRDYKTIRDTLCHELAHNVFGPHDRSFWDLCHQIEREVQAADWRSGGRTVAAADEDFYQSPEDDVPDHGGWTGGTYVLGGSSGGPQGLSRRDVIARAAEARLRNKREAEEAADEWGDAAEESSNANP